MSESWADWIGPVERATDQLTASLARRWLATFDRPADLAGALPHGIHFCLCPPDALTARLGEDGHPLRSGGAQRTFLPPVLLPRRMWAGSRIAFHAPLRVGAQVERTSRILSITEKTGSSGTLAFVEVEHTLTADGAEAVREVQTLVYRAAPASDAPLSPPPPAPDQRFDPNGWDHHAVIVPDPRLLFRYSALTFNTHRIHYDQPYAVEVERYRGLVVHGPLIATLLLQLITERMGGMPATFTFTGLSPAICGEPLHLVLREESEGLALAAFASDGRQITRASARLA